MANPIDLQHALVGLTEWSARHGIYEIREALQLASAAAEKAESNEELAFALGEAWAEAARAKAEEPVPPAEPKKGSTKESRPKEPSSKQNEPGEGTET